MARPGLQPERTSASWVRTGAAFVVVAALIARVALGAGDARSPDYVLLTISVIICAGCFVLFFLFARQEKLLHAARYKESGRFQLAATECRIVAALTVLASVGAIYAML